MDRQELHRKHQGEQALAEGQARGEVRLSDEDRWQPTARGLVGALIVDLQQLLAPANQAKRPLIEQEKREVLSRLETVKWLLTKVT